jgi:hypothetical protein
VSALQISIEFFGISVKTLLYFNLSKTKTENNTIEKKILSGAAAIWQESVPFRENDLGLYQNG